MDEHPYRVVVDAAAARVVVVSDRRGQRPTHGDERCPLCPGGPEAPTPFTAPYAFANRWPALGPGRCEIVVYSADHRAGLGDLTGAEAGAVVDLWAARTAELSALPDTHSVLVFENRGPEAGATVAHPHSQIFAFPFDPCPVRPVPVTLRCPLCAAVDPARLVDSAGGWSVAVPAAPVGPYSLRLAPDRHASGLTELTAAERRTLGSLLSQAIRRLDGVFQRPMPYHLWISQGTGTHLHVDIAGLRRSLTALRVLGAAEMATGLFFTPIAPESAAEALRAAAPYRK